MADTAFEQAFKAAGYGAGGGGGASGARLREVALKALLASPGNWDGAKAALFREVKGDAALLWEMFAAYRWKAAHDLLSEVAAEAREHEMRRREPARGGGAGQTPFDG